MKFLEWTDYVVEIPSVGSLSHLFAVLFTLFLSLIAAKTAKLVNDKKADTIVFSYGLFILILEIYKQLYMTYILCDGIYGWSYFPYQFCSVPMYVALIFPLIRNEKIKCAGYAFIATYGLLAGALVICIPAAVFSNRLSLNIHTILWHSMQVVIGVFIGNQRKIGSNYKSIIRAIIVFLSITAIALAANVIAYPLLDPKGYHFSALSFSPYYQTSFFVFDEIQAKTNWYFTYALYILSFTLGAYLMWIIFKAKYYSSQKHKKIK